jgi:hypothetical protein
MPADQLSPAPPDDAAVSGETQVPSRRSVLRGAAGVGAAGVAASAFMSLPAVAATIRPAAGARGGDARGDDARADAGDAASADQIVVHLRDARSGELDVYRGVTQVRVHDTELAARLVRASKQVR